MMRALFLEGTDDVLHRSKEVPIESEYCEMDFLPLLSLFANIPSKKENKLCFRCSNGNFYKKKRKLKKNSRKILARPSGLD